MPSRPASGLRSPWMHSTVVVFPAPSAPAKPTIAPARTSRSSRSTTTRFPYVLRRPRTVTTSVLAMSSIVAAPDRSHIGPRLEPGLLPRLESQPAGAGGDAHDRHATCDPVTRASRFLTGLATRYATLDSIGAGEDCGVLGGHPRGLMPVS